VRAVATFYESQASSPHAVFTFLLDSTKLPYGKEYVLPLITSTTALLFMLVSSYSCKFVKVTEDDDTSPFFFGIWKVEGAVGFGPFNTNECISWTDTPLYDDAGIRVSKIFSIGATFLGTAVWALLLTGTCQRLERHHRLAILVGASFCGVLTVLFFSVFGSDVCNVDGLTCRWGAAAYLTCTALILWTTTVLSVYTTTQEATSRERDMVTVVTSHSTPTVPTGFQSRPSPPAERHPDIEVADDSEGTDSPLISITEDEEGNLMKTTITRSVDEFGRTIIDRTVEQIFDNDRTETASV
jgi:hypothetical protein